MKSYGEARKERDLLQGGTSYKSAHIYGNKRKKQICSLLHWWKHFSLASSPGALDLTQIFQPPRLLAQWPYAGPLNHTYGDKLAQADHSRLDSHFGPAVSSLIYWSW